MTEKTQNIWSANMHDPKQPIESDDTAKIIKNWAGLPLASDLS